MKIMNKNQKNEIPAFKGGQGHPDSEIESDGAAMLLAITILGAAAGLLAIGLITWV